jgi:hypothetical protein
LQRTVLVALVAALAAVAGAALPAAATSTGAIDLRIAYRATPAVAPKLFTLACNPARGTVPSPATACRRLQALGNAAFAPTPRGRMCTQIAGGPMTAVVTGSFQGRRIWTRLTQSDGCAIARWNLVSFLLPRWKSGRPIGG